MTTKLVCTLSKRERERKLYNLKNQISKLSFKLFGYITLCTKEMQINLPLSCQFNS